MTISYDGKQIVEKARAVLRLQERMVEMQAMVADQSEKASRVLAMALQVQEHVDKIIDEKTKCFPWLAEAISDYYNLCDIRAAELLEDKLRPAKKAAERVREIASEKRMLHKKFMIARNRVQYYEALFPFLSEYVGEGLDELVAQVDDEAQADDAIMAEGEDPVKRYMPLAEYKALSSADRNQLALDRYRGRKKHSWEVGRDYERYIGYLYEKEGYCVSYFGATEGLRDLGRDLIAIRAGSALVIQCKYWRRERRIREKHIFQLYGTTVEYWLKNGGEHKKNEFQLFPDRIDGQNIIPVFVTSTKLSDEARGFADKLGVEIREEVLHRNDYPCIKCNISRSKQEKIYHLPFDQAYDKTIIEPERGEFYATTTAEAEKAGFRRAWRWRGGGKAD